MPVFFTKNGLATNTGRGGTINLKDDCYGKAAFFILPKLCRGGNVMTASTFDYISPVNEADGSWN